eukprot:1036179-Rhodomonas_salina.4
MGEQQQAREEPEVRQRAAFSASRQCDPAEQDGVECVRLRLEERSCCTLERVCFCQVGCLGRRPACSAMILTQPRAGSRGSRSRCSRCRRSTSRGAPDPCPCSARPLASRRTTQRGAGTAAGHAKGCGKVRGHEEDAERRVEAAAGLRRRCAARQRRAMSSSSVGVGCGET